LLYGELSAAPGTLAFHEETVYGGSEESSESPAWECADCKRRFGSVEHPYHENPPRSPREWTELLRTMLPSPVVERVDGELRGGDPVSVIVQIDEKEIRIMEATFKWDRPGRPQLHRIPFAVVPISDNAADVARLVMAAWAKWLSRNRWCPRCHRVVRPGYMNAGGLCDSCAAKVMDIVF
jgi:hypothetical protein